MRTFLVIGLFFFHLPSFTLANFTWMKNIFIILLSVFILNSCNSTPDGFYRHPAHIHYSKHAQCRMECRHINESEVKEILSNGTINYNKSDLKEDSCHKRYALEGYSHDNQKLRIIVAECNNELTVITVIDLGKEWPCSCE